MQYHCSTEYNNTSYGHKDLLDFGKLSHVRLCFIYTLNRKSTITSNENKARTELPRQQFKKVANSSKISRRIL